MRLGGGLQAAAELADLDILSFNAALESLLRLHAAQKCEDAWTAAVTAQGTSDNIRDWIRQRWEHVLGEQKQQNDLGEFLNKIGKGV